MPEPVITREISPLPERAIDAHKGDVGRLAIIGGCAGPVVMVGAPALAARAAFRSGVGLVQILAPQPILTTIAGLAELATTRELVDDASAIIEALRAFRADVLAIGPGLGTSLRADTIIAVLDGFDGPAVLDADALNVLADSGRTDLPRPGRIVITPHPGEAARLLPPAGAHQPGTSPAAQRRRTALDLVERYRCAVVFKGRDTLVTDGTRLYVNQTGNSGMATGGTGDVLTGIIAALLGQKLPLLEAAILGVYLHGLAGDFAAEDLGRHSLTALDMIDCLPEVFREHDTELE